MLNLCAAMFAFLFADNLSSFLNLFLPIFGIAIVLLALLSIFFPKTRPLREKTQRFTGLGVSMEVSILTVFVLMGFGLSLSSFFLQWKGYVDQKERFDQEKEQYEKKVTSLNTEITALQNQAVRSKTFDLPVVVRVEFKNTQGPLKLSVEDLTCEYQIGNLSVVRPDLSPGVRSNEFRMILKGINPETLCHFIKLTHNKNKKEWLYENFNPFESILQLKEESSDE